MDEPKAAHEPFGFACTRQYDDEGPAHCVLCYRLLVRIVAPVFMGRVA